MDMREIEEKVADEQYEISLHAEKERYAEDISISDLENVLRNGHIIENYPDDPRGDSCLVLGYSNGRAIHVVCGYGSNGWIRIITVYLPKPPRWINDRTRRPKGDGNA